MSSVEEIIKKAVEDADFRSSLLSDPAQALSGYELTADERASLSNLSEEFFEAEGLEDRISRWGGGLGSSI